VSTQAVKEEPRLESVRKNLYFQPLQKLFMELNVEMNKPFRAVSVGQWSDDVKLSRTVEEQPDVTVDTAAGLTKRKYSLADLSMLTWKREIEMMYMTLTLMAGIIAVMFVATAVSSIINSIRENEAARQAQTRRTAF
jgi:hypothetical protein